MAQQQILGKGNTTVSTSDGFTKVTFHNTEVVKYNEDKIVLDSGGWMTATTKTRMNQASNQFGLGYRVFQKKGDWFVHHKGKDINFSDDMVLMR